MMVRPELISASSAPRARPLNSCETKLPQVITPPPGTKRAFRPAGRNALSSRARQTLISRVLAGLAAEGVGLLHKRSAREDFEDFPEVFLVPHVLLSLTAHDDHRADALMVFRPVVHVADQGRDRFALLVGLDDGRRIEGARLFDHARPVSEAVVGVLRAPFRTRAELLHEFGVEH